MLGEDIDRLGEIQTEVSELINEARDILRDEGIVYDRAISYWIPHILMALTKEHEWLGGSMFTLEDTINELRESEVEGRGS